VTDPFQIALTYRGPLRHRGVSIARDTYGRTWILRLADSLWTLIDHHGEVVSSFTQKELCRIVMFPGAMRGYPDLYFFGLGPPVHCFAPEPAVVAALKPYIEESQRANAPRLATWHRKVGVRLLALGAFGLAIAVASLAWALWSLDAPFLRFNVALLLVPSGLLGGGYCIAGGLRDLRKARRFAEIAAARK
jgi:hypothetical protein